MLVVAIGNCRATWSWKMMAEQKGRCCRREGRQLVAVDRVVDGGQGLLVRAGRVGLAWLAGSLAARLQLEFGTLCHGDRCCKIKSAFAP
ncbi:hypothetical protein ACLOJK_019116 [Asimina triloba]